METTPAEYLSTIKKLSPLAPTTINNNPTTGLGIVVHAFSAPSFSIP
jgi:hypothetical protein